MTDAYNDLMLFLKNKQFNVKPYSGGFEVMLPHHPVSFSWIVLLDNFNKDELHRFIFAYGAFCGENQIENP